jgi:hypothetical protein
MRSGAIGLRQLADVPPDTPVKLAMHFYAFEHLEIATYEFLIKLAEEAGDKDTIETAKKILEQEQQAAEKVHESFDRSAELTLEQEPQPTEGEGDEEEEGEEEDSQGQTEGEDKGEAKDEDEDEGEAEGEGEKEGDEEKQTSSA